MRKIDLSPEAYNDLEGIKERLNTEFGEVTEKKILKLIVKDMKRPIFRLYQLMIKQSWIR